MDLMKELIGQPVEEANHNDFSDAKYKRFKTIMHIVAKELDHLHALTKDGGGFTKLVQELGGDHGAVAEARKYVRNLDDVMSDIEMSVGMAREPRDD